MSLPDENRQKTLLKRIGKLTFARTREGLIARGIALLSKDLEAGPSVRSSCSRAGPQAGRREGAQHLAFAFARSPWGTVFGPQPGEGPEPGRAGRGGQRAGEVTRGPLRRRRGGCARGGGGGDPLSAVLVMASPPGLAHAHGRVCLGRCPWGVGVFEGRYCSDVTRLWHWIRQHYPDYTLTRR